MFGIGVQGRLAQRRGSAFEGITLEAATAEALFADEIRYQSRFYGVLDSKRDLGLELVSLEPLR
jgi:hypothetical protein